MRRPISACSKTGSDVFPWNYQAVFGIDIIAPQKFGSTPIDLVVSGPNEGQNNGPFIFTLSGTVGATYVSVERGVVYSSKT